MQPVDTSVKVLGLRFRSPILVSSSEAAFDASQCSDLIRRPIGGIITKTFTSDPANRIRLRPYQFPLKRFGRAYGDALFSLAAPHVEDMETVFHRVRSMAEVCHRDSRVLIASFFEDPHDMPLWLDRAMKFQDMDADMLELNFSSPSAAKVFAGNVNRSTEIIERVKSSVSIPVGLKLSPTLEPLEALIQRWTNAGLDFITAHNAPGGVFIDVDNMVPFGAPCIGGYVSGKSFLPYSLARVIRIRRVTTIPVIGVGGIQDSDDALQYLLAGCPLVGVGSALYFHGPERLNHIYQGMTDWMEKKAYHAVSQFTGKVFPLIRDASVLKSTENCPFAMPPDCPYVPVIDPDRCTRCGTCAKACIYNALIFTGKEEKIVVDDARCWSCGFCVGVCPTGAVELRERTDLEKSIWNNRGMASPFVETT
ncbi:MAG: 4Fe-4S binding protein [Pseudomonadota bacterium]